MVDKPMQMQGQMQGQMLDSAFTTAAKHLPYKTSTPWIDPSLRSPFLAAYLENTMQDEIALRIKRTHRHYDGRIISMGWQSGTPEPPPPLRPGADNTEVRLLGAADNRTGLQILMFSINGRTMRKDKIPFHSIWSVDDARIPVLLRDDKHTWPQSETIDTGKKGVKLSDRFISQTVFEKTHRILTDVELEAEALATACYDIAMAGKDVITPDFDYLARAIDLEFPSSIWHPFRLITYESKGIRQAQDVDLRV